MTNEELKAIEAKRQAISESDWKTGEDGEGSIGVWMGEAHWVGWDIENTCRECFANLEFVASAPAIVDGLIAEIRRLQQIEQVAREFIEANGAAKISAHYELSVTLGYIDKRAMTLPGLED